MSSVIQRAFASGELGPDLYARADQAKYQAGLRTCRNFLVMRHGGVTRRPGHRLVDEGKTSSLPTLMTRFVFNEDQTYLIEVGHHYFRFYRGGAQIVVSGVAAWSNVTAYAVGDLALQGGVNYYCILANTNNAPPNGTYWYALTGSVYEIPTPYDSADLDRLRFTQSADIVTITHKGYDIRELRRTGHTAWTLTLKALGASIAAPDNPIGDNAAPNPDARVDGLVNFTDFSPTGDGVADNLIPLTNFINAVKASPMKRGIMHDGIFAISDELPNLNVDGIKISGTGPSGAHNVGPDGTGTVIKWIGAAGGTMWQSTAPEGGSNQYLTGVELTGITLDCNSGLADYGMIFKSHRHPNIDVSVLNAGVVGMLMSNVTLLGDPRDLQRGTISYVGRQWEAPAGYSLKLDGDSGSNVSLNDFNVIDILYMDVPAIWSVNPDHNHWRSVRLYKHPSGAATRSWIWSGGPTAFNVTYGEIVEYLSASDPVQAGGTDEYAYPSLYNRIKDFDSANSGFTDAIVRGTGAIAYWASDKTPFWDALPETYVPVLTPQAGAFGSITGLSGIFQRTPHGADFAIELVIAGIGTVLSLGSTYFSASLPLTASADWPAVVQVKDTATGKMGSGFIPVGSSVVFIQDADGAFLGNTGSTIIISGSYKTSQFTL